MAELLVQERLPHQAKGLFRFLYFLPPPGGLLPRPPPEGSPVLLGQLGLVGVLLMKHPLV